MRLRGWCIFYATKMTCTLDGDCTEEDIDAVLRWNGTGTVFLRCLRNCTNSNPTFVGVPSLNLENHLLPTFQKCLCVFLHIRTR